MWTASLSKWGPADTAARWPLQPGLHTFEAKLPYRGLSSRPITIEVE